MACPGGQTDGVFDAGVLAKSIACDMTGALVSAVGFITLVYLEILMAVKQHNQSSGFVEPPVAMRP